LGVYRPSPLVRWPLHFLNLLLVFTILALLGTIALYRYLGEPPPWALIGSGSTICVLFVAFNLAVVTLRLRVDEGGLRLRIWPFVRQIPWSGAEVRKETRPGVGVIAVRVFGGDGRRIWLSPAWFHEFEEALAEIEERAAAGGGSVSELQR
jgi:hypothetical protein